MAATVFVLFIASMSFYKGDLCWGPRYLTPVFALMWLFAPAVASATALWGPPWPRRLVTGLLGLGLLVQLLGLSVDPLRLYVHHRLPSGWFCGNEWLHFHPALSHLGTRPREILEICRDDGSATVAFSPDPLPTSMRKLLEETESGPQAVRKYRYLNSFRPWWSSMCWLPPADHPVALLPTAGLLLSLALAGLGMMAAALHGGRRKRLTTEHTEDTEKEKDKVARSSVCSVCSVVNLFLLSSLCLCGSLVFASDTSSDRIGTRIDHFTLSRCSGADAPTE